MQAGYSGLMDFILAFLPWTIVWNLQMKRREKLGVGIAMSLGVLYDDPNALHTRRLNFYSAGITAVIKTSFLRQIGLQQDFTCMKPFCASNLN